MNATALDMCCGAGGVTEGYRQAGVNVLAGIDIDPIACESFERNHPGVEVIERGLEEVSPRGLLRSLGLAPRQLTMLTACVPCQTFSTIGAKNRKARDPRPRLVERVGDFVAVFRPRFLVMENVPQVETHYRFAALRRRLRQLHYAVRHEVLDFARYGVPQHRRRLLLIAERDSKREVPFPSTSNGTSRRFEREVTVRSVIGRLGPRYQDALHDRERPLHARVLARTVCIPADGGSRDSLPGGLRLACHGKLTKSAAVNVYGRMKWDAPAPTLTTRCTTPACGRFLHPEEDRPITLREAALLQTFPPTYTFAGSRGEVERQIGNAVPPRIATVIAKVLQES